MKDALILIAMILFLEGMKWVFGVGVALAVSITALIGIVLFLYQVGKDAA